LLEVTHDLGMRGTGDRRVSERTERGLQRHQARVGLLVVVLLPVLTDRERADERRQSRALQHECHEDHAKGDEENLITGGEQCT